MPVLGIIDQAIIDLESEALNAQSTAPTPVTPTRLTPAWIPQPPVFRPPPSLAHSYSSSSSKRQAEDPDIIDGSPKSKKQKQREYENNRDHSRVLERPLSNTVNHSPIFYQL